MKTIKHIVWILLLVLCCQATFAEKRKAMRPLKDFQNPNSPSYVPYPYPKNHDEIIEDLKYAMKLHHAHSSPLEILAGTKPDPSEEILIRVLDKDANVEISDIIKVKNRIASMEDDYSYLIILKNKKGELLANIALDASGLYIGSKATSKISPLKPIKNKTEVIQFLSEKVDTGIDSQKINSSELVILGGNYHFFPMWEVVLRDGTKYYLDCLDRIYRVKRELDWVQSKDRSPGFGNFTRQQPNEVIFSDTINDKLLFMEELNKIMIYPTVN